MSASVAELSGWMKVARPARTQGVTSCSPSPPPPLRPRPIRSPTSGALRLRERSTHRQRARPTTRCGHRGIARCRRRSLGGRHGPFTARARVRTHPVNGPVRRLADPLAGRHWPGRARPWRFGRCVRRGERRARQGHDRRWRPHHTTRRVGRPRMRLTRTWAADGCPASARVGHPRPRTPIGDRGS